MSTARASLVERWRRLLPLTFCAALVLGALLVFLARTDARAVPPSPCGSGLLTAPNTCTYTTPGEATFTVPTGVTTVRVVAIGGRGGTGAGTQQLAGVGGFGARVSADLSTTAGTTFYVHPAANGVNGVAAGAGGSNGGGVGGSAGSSGGGGGGA